MSIKLVSWVTKNCLWAENSAGRGRTGIIFTSGEPAFIGRRAAAVTQRGPCVISARFPQGPGAASVGPLAGADGSDSVTQSGRRSGLGRAPRLGVRPHFSSKLRRFRLWARLASALSRIRSPRDPARGSRLPEAIRGRPFLTVDRSESAPARAPLSVWGRARDPS